MPDINDQPQESGNTPEQSSPKDDPSGNPPVAGEFPVSVYQGGTPVLIDTTTRAEEKGEHK
ncbi:hypothetical protein FOQG_17629 [Fusarium oxysporum f. sp. raphani 54005]|uniref:Uncharacterized protein n=1 Tax=Fusarium oxysporum f. sp. raphani 54005 TaxID=1089458 RepID=X0B7F1_FUSOX|nr:hypothetical protein FOQG_17629 [Fusarium oxysporum f. sp. raphani 54005]